MIAVPNGGPFGVSWTLERTASLQCVVEKRLLLQPALLQLSDDATVLFGTSHLP